MRAKNSADEEWNYLNEDEPFQSFSFKCDSLDSELCTYFPVGFVAQLDYEVYDVAVEVLPDEIFKAMDDISVNFHIAYVNPQFTLFQLYLRSIFTILSMLVLCFYSTKLCCRVPANLQRQMTFEQKGTLALIMLLFLFNDPFYPAHIYKPSFMTFASTEMTSAMFVTSLLIYWLRELAGFKPETD